MALLHCRRFRPTERSWTPPALAVHKDVPGLGVEKRMNSPDGVLTTIPKLHWKTAADTRSRRPGFRRGHLRSLHCHVLGRPYEAVHLASKGDDALSSSLDLLAALLSAASDGTDAARMPRTGRLAHRSASGLAVEAVDAPLRSYCLCQHRALRL